MSNVRYVDFGGQAVELAKSEIAGRLGYCERTIEKFTAEGMPSRMRGRRRTWQEAQCRNWLNSQGKGGIAHARQAVS